MFFHKFLDILLWKQFCKPDVKITLSIVKIKKNQKLREYLLRKNLPGQKTYG